ncbi:hypothetical protein NH340_JMT06253 [Sarcoptes scabiei]|nr:hypothetical protein NH340_JMT06253 [Sarcoptes scabiei]
MCFQQTIFEKFLKPLVRSLDGTEDEDPNLNDDVQCNHINGNIGEVYDIFKIYRKQFNRTIIRMNEIINMFSLFIQRLLPLLKLPNASDHCCSFRFESSDNVEMLNESIDNECEQSDDEIEVYNEYSDFMDSDDLIDENDSDALNDNELDDNNEIAEKMTNHTAEDSQNRAEFFIDSYLRYFPEVFEFYDQTKLLTQQIGDFLVCSCEEIIESPANNLSKDDGSENFIEKHPSMFDDDDQKRSDLGENFNWSEVFKKNYQSTRIILPNEQIPSPESNFTDDQNVLCRGHPMSYPFLNQYFRWKNYYRIKLIDHINDRLCGQELSENLILVYDITSGKTPTKSKTIASDIGCSESYLRFESRFECGNLRKAYYCQRSNQNHPNEEEYILILNNDINSNRHTQWFYFSVSEMKPNKKYRFKMINHEKKSILYNCGQQPLVYSEVEFRNFSKGWNRINSMNFGKTFGSNSVAFYRNHYIRNEKIDRFVGKKIKSYYTLEFTFQFPHENDRCYFAFNIPFSYSQLKTCISYWHYLAKNFNKNSQQNCTNGKNPIYFASQTLCSTLNKNPLPLLTITSNNCRYREKHYIMITARIHPAESNSSWICKGFIDFLLKENKSSAKEEQCRQRLLDKYVFKIIPMINPDGVINGNTRTDLQANDLNRKWADPSSKLHPTIFHAKSLLQCLHYHSKSKNPVVFIDLHGHSRRHDLFSYGCFSNQSWKKSDRQLFQKKFSQNHSCICKEFSNCSLQKNIQMLKAKFEENDYFLVPSFTVLPITLLLNSAPIFELESCSFIVQQDRETTARIVCWRQFEIPLVYTIECSAGGCMNGPYVGHNLSIRMLEEMGQFIANSFDLTRFTFCSTKHYPLIMLPKAFRAETNDENNCPRLSSENDLILS